MLYKICKVSQDVPKCKEGEADEKTKSSADVSNQGFKVIANNLMIREAIADHIGLILVCIYCIGEGQIESKFSISFGHTKTRKVQHLKFEHLMKFDCHLIHLTKFHQRLMIIDQHLMRFDQPFMFFVKQLMTLDHHF